MQSATDICSSVTSVQLFGCSGVGGGPMGVIVWPVTNDAAGLARNRTMSATSSGVTTIDLLEEYGTDGLLLNSAGDWEPVGPTHSPESP